MAAEPIDVTKLVLRTLRFLDDGRRSAEQQWRRLTHTDPGHTTAASDRRRPPQVW
ncbi:MAG TPA: hypothetical protein PKD84_02855 [Propionicimonas sp.]|jgi:hypothetical protein|nr:hypothetical protein [Propionicimonas sp.]